MSEQLATSREERRFLRKHRRHESFETRTIARYRYMQCKRCGKAYFAWLDGGRPVASIGCPVCGTTTQLDMTAESGNCPTCGKELFSEAVSY